MSSQLGIAAVTLACLLGFTLQAAEPEAPPVDLLVFTDFECPFCAQLAPAVSQVLHDYPGRVRVTMKNNPLPMHEHSRLAHRAALAAQEQGKFWPMHDTLFTNQDHLEKADLLRYAAQVGLDTKTFSEALESTRLDEAVTRDLAEAHALGVDATPTLFLNGRKMMGSQSAAALKAAVEAALSGQAPPTAEISAAEPVSIDLSGMQLRGNAKAAVTVIEFADMECPFCARIVSMTAELAKKYPTQVNFGLKHYPLNMHEHAIEAAEALEAAKEQGRFWEMQDLLLTKQDSLDHAGLIAAAKAIHLNVPRFTRDLDSHRFRELVSHDKAEGDRFGVDGTPTLFVNGRRLDVLRSFDDLDQAVQFELSKTAPLPNTGSTVTPEPVAVKIASPSKGPANAPISLVWFDDVQSAFSPRANMLVEQLMSAYPGQVRVEFRNLPLPVHNEAMLAHEALLAAGAENKFWEMHALLMQNRKAWKQADLEGYAKELGLNSEAFAQALSSHVYRPNIQGEMADAQRREIRGTPAFLVNGRRVDGLQPLSVFRSIVEPSITGSQAGTK